MSIKKNFLYSSILTTANYIFPLITFPYVSRVLGVSNVGLVNFVDGIVNYFILFSMLGITVLGIREIAKNQRNQILLNKTFSTLFSIHAILTSLFLVVYVILLFGVPKFIEYRTLFFIGIFKLLFNLFLIEWFYKGIEKFSYITICGLCIRILYVVGLFLIVKKESDYNLYFGLTVGVVVINSFINWIHSRKYVSFSYPSLRDLFMYLKSYIFLGLYLLVTSMYTTFNITYLGFVSSNEEVGYYVTALKIYTIFLSILTAFTWVMMPRMSALISEHDYDKFKIMIVRSFDVLFTISFPLIIVSVILSPQIIVLLSGSGYEGAVIPMCIIMPLILFAGISQILAYQVLLPLKEDKIMLRVSFVGAIVGVFLNISIVNMYQSIGTAFVLLASEVVVSVFLYFTVRNRGIIIFPYNSFFKNLLLSIPYIVICLVIKMLFESYISILCYSVSLTLMYFLLSQCFLLKNEVIISLCCSLMKHQK